MVKIKCIGFSVTGYGDPSYPNDLGIKLNAIYGPKCSVSYASVGGLSINSLPYLANKLCFETDLDILFVEIATSWISLHFDDEQLAYELILHSLTHFIGCANKVVFLNLYRRDINDNDMVVRAINKFSSKGFEIIDLKGHFRNNLLTRGDDGTLDGVHPTPETIDYISNSLLNYVNKYIASNVVDKSTKINIPHDFSSSILLPAIDNLNKITFNNRHGVVLDALISDEGQQCDYVFSRPVFLNGIFFIWGPDTAKINLTINDYTFKVNMYDEMSFYRRVGFHGFNKTLTNSLSWKLDPDRTDVILNREPWEEVNDLHCYLIGFAVSVK